MSEPIPVPSGQDVRLIEVIRDTQGPEGLTLRYRFLAPAIAADVDFDAAAQDMQALCENYALPRVPQTGPMPSQIIISLSAENLPFGEDSPDAVQYFEGYTLEDGHCMLSLF